MQFLIHLTIEEFKALLKQTVKEVITETSINNRTELQDDQDEFMNVKQASAFLNLAKSTIYEKTSNRILPHFKRSNKLMFKRSELTQWLEDGKVLTQKEHLQNAEIEYQKLNKKR